MSELRLSYAQLAQRTGLSETTIRYIGQPGTTRTRSVLVALSAVLGWQPDHLANILDGHPGSNAPALQDALLETLNEKVGKLKTDLRAIETLVDRLRSEHRQGTTRT
jgi:hypothetical protein